MGRIGRMYYISVFFERMAVVATVRLVVASVRAHRACLSENKTAGRSS